jgi:hypothetical protein
MEVKNMSEEIINKNIPGGAFPNSEGSAFSGGIGGVNDPGFPWRNIRRL